MVHLIISNENDKIYFDKVYNYLLLSESQIFTNNNSIKYLDLYDISFNSKKIEYISLSNLTNDSSKIKFEIGLLNKRFILSVIPNLKDKFNIIKEDFIELNNLFKKILIERKSISNINFTDKIISI